MKYRCAVCATIAWLLMWAALATGQDTKTETKPSIAAPPVTSTSKSAEPEPVTPKEVIKLFNGKDLTGLYTWLTDTKYEDPRMVFSVTPEGYLRISGDGYGYICTRGAYRDYHLIAEYRWGKATWGGREKASKDSGILLHCTGPDGNSGAWMASIECQIIQGGTGDFIIVQARDKSIPVRLTCEIEKRGRANVWKKGGEAKVFTGGRIDWFGRDPEWKDVLGFRGANDVESPDVEGEAGWTRLECICDGGMITNIVNGTVVNVGTDANPSAGKILLQSEGAEILFRKFELHPLQREPLVK